MKDDENLDTRLHIYVTSSIFIILFFRIVFFMKIDETDSIVWSYACFILITLFASIFSYFSIIFASRNSTIKMSILLTLSAICMQSADTLQLNKDLNDSTVSFIMICLLNLFSLIYFTVATYEFLKEIGNRHK